jgi:hypothetical protein
MYPNYNLSSIEQRVLHSYFCDGLIDMVLGVQLVLLSLLLRNPAFSFVSIWTPLALGGIELIRRRLTYPRIGYVKMPTPVTLFVKLLFTFLLAMIFSLGVSVLVRVILGLPLAGDWRSVLPFAVSVFATVMVCFLAYKFRARRWYAYGLSMGLVFVIGRRLDEPLLTAGLGIVILVWGAVVMARFVRKHPLPSEAARQIDPLSIEPPGG